MLVPYLSVQPVHGTSQSFSLPSEMGTSVSHTRSSSVFVSATASPQPSPARIHMLLCHDTVHAVPSALRQPVTK